MDRDRQSIFWPVLVCVVLSACLLGLIFEEQIAGFLAGLMPEFNVELPQFDDSMRQKITKDMGTE